MHVNLLGPLQVQRFGVEIEISAAKQRAVLAALSLNAGQVVPTYQLVDELWEDEPPASATRTVQTYVYHLRKLLSLGDGQDGDLSRSALLTRTGGYELRLGSGAALDIIRFETLVGTARTEFDHERFAEAAHSLRAALDLWRGPAFAGVEMGPMLSSVAVRLGQSRKSAVELRVDTDLRLGRHHQLIDELYGLTRHEPTHEAFSAKLMLALHRSGRRAEALEVFHRLRAQLDQEFGVAPSASVQRVLQEVLQDEPIDVPRQREVVPARRTELPEPPALVGRGRELAGLREVLTRPNHGGLRVIEIVGAPGVGTSAIALKAAHDLRDHFPGGVVVIDLAGTDQQPDSGAALIRDRLHRAGVPMPAVADLDEVGRRFRAWSAHGRTLVIVDHASSVSVLGALRPGGQDSAMIVVSRLCLPGAVGNLLFELGPLPREEGVRLLAALSGEHRVRREPEAAGLIADLCEGVPLALCGVARWLACHPSWPLGRAVRELEADPRRLTGLWLEGRTFEDSVRSRLRDVPTDSETALTTLAAAPARRLCTGGLSSVLGWAPARSETALHGLTNANLVDELPTGAFRIRRLVAHALHTVARPSPLKHLGVPQQV
ncbi:BTAD domain-containing putative transcriptional regulator [Lentzea sp. NPDC092896]|uniref:BTAD domain-containing putative transcriptional regulator n=1 Tax=Lentzea sp. NPDC092896 TaxID=3364127 RepID=UPI0037F28F37